MLPFFLSLSSLPFNEKQKRLKIRDEKIMLVQLAVYIQKKILKLFRLIIFAPSFLSFVDYFCFADDHFSNFDVSARLANFLMLFRTLLPDVYNHFEDEEVDNKEWSTSWCQYLLAKELPLECRFKSVVLGLLKK